MLLNIVESHRSSYYTDKTTVSRLFSDRHSGAATDKLYGSEETSTHKQRSLLSRLHLHSSLKRGKSPAPLIPSIISRSSVVDGLTAHRESPTGSVNDVNEIIRIMPQSLLLSKTESTSTKRQRSADGRDWNEDRETVNDGALNTETRQDLSNDVRVPPYLLKSSNGEFYGDWSI